MIETQNNEIKFSGQIKKMITEHQNPIEYYLDLESDFLSLNQLINQRITIQHTHNQCLNCDLDKDIFRMGYCKNCFFEVPQTNESIIRPELSRAHLGEEQRDLAWEQAFELQPHVVYLAETSHLKVGVTREKQLPTRWIDQGAKQAIVLAKTNNRYQAGMIEVALKEFVADKTSWQKMLKSINTVELDLLQEKERIKPKVPKEYQKFITQEDQVQELFYPVEERIEKVKSVNLKKQNQYQGTLIGIKGQYLIFEDNAVFNVRSHEGFVVDIFI